MNHSFVNSVSVYIIEIAFFLAPRWSLTSVCWLAHGSRLGLLVPSLELMKLQPVSCSVATRRCYPWSIWNIDSTSILRKRETRWKKMSALKTVQLFNGGWRSDSLSWNSRLYFFVAVQRFPLAVSYVALLAQSWLGLWSLSTRPKWHWYLWQRWRASCWWPSACSVSIHKASLCLIVCQLMGYDILIHSQIPTRHVSDSSAWFGGPPLN